MTTLRQLPLSRLGHLVPPLVESAALIALIPATEDMPWAAKAALDIARIAARDGRRVALVDLCLETPALHETVGLKATEGIVDAFEYGVSLNKAAHEVTGVFIIPAGSETAHPAEVYAHNRWRKLQAGFRSEGALLLALVPFSALAQLSARPDGAIVLAPNGVGQEVAALTDVPLLGVVRDRWLPAPQRTSPPVSTIPEVTERRRASRLVLALLIVAALAAGGLALARARAAFVASPTPQPSATPPTTLHQPPPPHPPQPVAPPQLDTLGWAIQLAAYASLDKALAHVDRLSADAGVPALVTPVPQTGSGPVWYRVLAGSYATRAAAGAARAQLWRRGVTSEGVGDLVFAPYSYHASAGASLDMLRHQGLPAVRWSNGVILLGAFEAPDQAAYTQGQLKRAGVRANLLPRMGTP